MRKDNDRPDVYISVYMPVAGWKAIMYAVDEECGGHHTPWETAPVAFDTKARAIKYGEAWAKDLELEFFDDCPSQTDDAPDKSVGDQLRELMGLLHEADL